MHIETARLRLVPFTQEQLPVITRQNYRNGPEISNHLKALEQDPSLLFWGSWLIIRQADDVIIGDAGFKGKPNPHGAVEIGYGLLEQYWHNGYATEAVAGLIQWAQQTTSVLKVVAKTEATDQGSIRVLNKVNMERVRETDGMIYWEIQTT
ncbi:GNAT family N-acetyltransferase [Exiguobacterium oxidotolerans]|uniref:GNAT family N-acetyltransferase n=1 Tax=Exiguobacterium oxidotolerans TaxID=223958 RepID=UPI0004941A4E|nr:GNAT family N-acetyltransferase [Exiguobacterium oxidotolerans]